MFEYIYFARPDSVVEGMPVYDARKRIGARWPARAASPADVVVPVPDSGVPSAMGYAEESGLPFELGIIRNHYVGRTFIEPTDQIRNLGVKLKHSANRAVLTGKRVILVDDSIVRGTTSRKIVEMVRQAGAAEVHMRISSPPTTHSCFYGIDTPERGKLLAARHDVAEMARLIGADSLAFISIDGLYQALGKAGGRGRARLLRRLLHRRLPDRPVRHDERGGAAAQPAARTCGPADRARHRCQPRHRRGRRPSRWPAPACTSCSPRAPRAGWRRPTTPSAPPAAPPRCCRWTWRTAPRWT